MQPTGYPVRYDILQQYWQSFVTTGRVTAVPDYLPDPIVLRSWQRCAPRFDPYANPRPTIIQPNALSAILKAQADLVSLAMPLLEDMHQFLEGGNCALLLTDGSGCLLDVKGDVSAINRVYALGFGPGAVWSETYLGTNGLGLALINAVPVQVVGAEHYFQVHQEYVSSAAPIHDVNGRIIGLLGIVEPASAATSHSLSLVMSGARAISNQFQANLYLEEANHRLSEVKTILESIQEGVIAWDASGRVNHINQQAGRLLGLNPTVATGSNLYDMLTLPPSLLEAIEQRHGLVDAEVQFDLNRYHSVQTLTTLHLIMEGDKQPTGYVLLLRPIQQVRRLVHQQVGTQALVLLEDISAYSSAMRPVLRQVRIAARGTAPVLLRGEGGVGKNHMARAIHNEGPRADKPFMAINCRAIPHELMIGEFLGYEKDETTNGRPSKFELADGGTLMFDQIESLSLEMQSALLHVIETGYVMRLGGTRPIPIDVRIIVATAANLEALVTDGTFVAHLYYRFGVFNVVIPPLRERVEDIPLLAQRFLARITGRGHQEVTLSEEAIAILCRYPWPGNVRELESALERALLQAQKGVIHAADLPEAVRLGRVMSNRSPQAQPVISTLEAEREAILLAGWACQGRVGEMARQLGIGRTTLWRKLRRFEIDPETFKS